MAVVEEAFDPAVLELVSSKSSVARVEGHVDLFAEGWVRGWAWLPDEAAAVVVEAWQGGELRAVALAVNYRADLDAAGKRGGYCAFDMCLIGRLPEAGEVLIRARQGTAGANLHGSSLAFSEEQWVKLSCLASPRSPMLVPFSLDAGVIGFIDTLGANQIRGWVFGANELDDPVVFSIYDQGEELLRVEAINWRSDLAELRQGDGLCGFEVPTPPSLCDGQLHVLEIVSLDGRCLIHGPLPLRINSTSAPALPVQLEGSSAHTKRLPKPCAVSARKGELTLSVIVNFYNMPREAARTLHSLGRDYQRGIDDLDYEVLCIDNGSRPPLERAWVESFGPQFRLIRPEQPLASPCSAINAAAAEARGEYLAVMIDGAHVLTPGVLREAIAAFGQDKAALVAVRHWFIGGDQRWLAASGYTREMEDKLFSRIHWPKRGYEMFRIGAPIGESHDPWFTGLSESNCLFVPADRYAAIGGMDEAFITPGAGYANLDLLRRAASGVEEGLVCLLGEASFHQYHEGTTTNVTDDEKDVRVRAYAQEYRRLRGEDFRIIDSEKLRLRGSIHSEHAISVHQRPLLPMTLGVTPAVRRGMLAQHFTEGARQHLQSVYAECDLQRHTRWLGQEVSLAPADLIAIQEIIGSVRPSRVVSTSAQPGLLRFVLSMFDLFGIGDGRVVVVGSPQDGQRIDHARVSWIEAAPDELDTLAAVDAAIGAEESSLVLFSPVDGDAIPLTMLRAYARFVSYRSYLIFLGTVRGQPWLGYSSRWYLSAIRSFIKSDAGFVVDHSRDRQIISMCASGYLRRIGHGCTAEVYDASLDQFDSL